MTGLMESESIMLEQMQRDYSDLCERLAARVATTFQGLGSTERGCNNYVRAVTNDDRADGQIEFIYTLVPDYAPVIFTARAVRVLPSGEYINTPTRELKTCEDYYDMITYLRASVAAKEVPPFHVWVI